MIVNFRNKSFGVSIVVLLLIMISLPQYTQSISFFLRENRLSNSVVMKKCFLSTVFKEERLKIQVDLPVIKQSLQTQIQVFLTEKNKQTNKTQRKLVFTEAINHFKYQATVNKSSHEVHELEDDHPLEYQTCLFMKKKDGYKTKPDTASDIVATSDGVSTVPISRNTPQQPQSYLFSMSLLTNFNHILQQKRSQPPKSSHKYTRSNLDQLKKDSQKLYLIAKQQVQIHQVNEKLQIQIQNHMKEIQNNIYSASIMQSALLVFGSLMHINLMRSYLKGKV